MTYPHTRSMIPSSKNKTLNRVLGTKPQRLCNGSKVLSKGLQQNKIFALTQRIVATFRSFVYKYTNKIRKIIVRNERKIGT